MRMFIRFLLCTAFVAFSGSLSAEQTSSNSVPVDDLVRPALESAFQGDLERAATLLESNLMAAPEDPLLIWNLAAVRTRQERMGDALHAVLRILALDAPKEIESRARELRSQIVSKLFEKARRAGNPDVFSIRDPRSFWERWVMGVQPDTWRWLFYASFWLVAFLLIAGRRGKALFQTVHATLLVLGILAVLIFGFSDWASRYWVQPAKIAVVRADKALLRHSLVKGARVDMVPEGVVLSVGSETVPLADGEDAHPVRLPDGREGYMAKSDLGLVP